MTDSGARSRWSREPARPWHVYAVAAALALALYIVVYGPGHLLGTNAYWTLPVLDERMALIGYRYFLHEPWHWPVFVSHAINVPYPTSVAFSDCIPLWALVNKTIATVIPPWQSFSSHAYLGLWHGLTYALQPCFGVAILRRLGHRGWSASVLSALFFLAVPAWIARYGHPGLSAHWIELWAIYLYLATPAGGPWHRRLTVAWIALLAIASLVTPYHAAMALGVFIASLVRSRQARAAATLLPLGLASIAIALWFAGYFAQQIATAQWGFSRESTNVLSWLIPIRSGILGDARWIANVDATGYEYEGAAYLGLGGLALLALLLPQVRTLPAVARRHIALFTFALACWLFAMSNHVYFGSHELVTFPIPKLLRWLTLQFRAPGRFVWIPMYVLLAYVLHRSLTRFAVGWQRAIPVIAVAIQLLDASGEWKAQRAETDGARAVILASDRWRPLVDAHDAVAIYPSYFCVLDSGYTSGPHILSSEIQLLASERGTPINGTYNTRPIRDCAAELRQWPRLEPRPGTLYVLLTEATAIADRFAAGGAHCAAFDAGRVCSSDAAALADAIRAGILRPPPAPIRMRYGEPLVLAALPDPAPGWSAPEAGGRWSIDAMPSLLVQLEGDAPATVGLRIAAAARLCGTRTSEDVDVLIDGVALTTLHFTPDANDVATTRTIAIPDAGRLRNAVALELVPHDIRSPAALKCSADARRLGVFVASISFE